MLKIIAATKAAIPIIHELAYKIWPDAYGEILAADQITYMLDWMYSPHALEEQMNSGISFIVGYLENKPVGFAGFKSIDKQTGKLEKLYILSTEQGKGIGKQLLDYVILYFRQKSVAELTLQVNRNNKARLFYEKQGFVIARVMDFDIGKGYKMNDYTMRLKL